MTVASELSKIVHVTDGVSVSFAVPFRFLHASHLRVTEARHGVETVLTPTTHYSVTGDGSQQGGAVVTTPARAAGAKLVIERIVPLTQEIQYPRNDPFPASAHEQALDKLTMIDQQHAEGLSRAVKLPVSDPRTPEEFTEEFFQAAQDAIDAAAPLAASIASWAAWKNSSVNSSGVRGSETGSLTAPSGGKDGDIWFQVI